jgi:inhibitor of KinA sporulation pathway (predicted exonuclease)
MELTSITQNDVDNGIDRKIALQNFINFCGEDCVIMSWGGYDKNQLKKEFEKFKLPTTILKQHKNLKEYFSKIVGSTKQYGMAKALKIANIKLTGTHHRGIDDAKNISKIFIKYFDKWGF